MQMAREAVCQPSSALIEYGGGGGGGGGVAVVIAVGWFDGGTVCRGRRVCEAVGGIACLVAGASSGCEGGVGGSTLSGSFAVNCITWLTVDLTQTELTGP
jgi:hypothetical protein